MFRSLFSCVGVYLVTSFDLLQNVVVTNLLHVVNLLDL